MAPYRLKLRAIDGHAEALLYPVDVNAYGAPLVRFPLEPYQELPRIPVGDVVEVVGDVDDHRVEWVRCADETTLRPAGKVRVGEGSPLFAEPTTFWHPAFAEHDPWTAARTGVPTTVDEWEADLDRRATRARWSVTLAVGFVTLLAAIVVILVVAGDGPFAVGISVRWAPGGGVAGVGAIAALQRARAGRSTLARARQVRAEPGYAMQMRLWWSAGDGWGPVPVASVAETVESAPYRIRLAAVPAGFDPLPWVVVQVHGGLGAGGTPIIRCRDVELWPAATVGAVLGEPRRLRDQVAAWMEISA